MHDDANYSEQNDENYFEKVSEYHEGTGWMQSKEKKKKQSAVY